MPKTQGNIVLASGFAEGGRVRRLVTKTADNRFWWAAAHAQLQPTLMGLWERRQLSETNRGCFALGANEGSSSNLPIPLPNKRVATARSMATFPNFLDIGDGPS